MNNQTGQTSALTVVVVEYFSSTYLHTLMASVAEFEPGTPVLVSSNSVYSLKGQEAIEREFPFATFIHNGCNLGYAGGVNRALEHVNTPYVAILNPDVELQGPISAATDAIFQSYPQVALFGPSVINGSGIPSYSFRRFYPTSYIIARYVGNGSTAHSRRIQDYYLMSKFPRDRFTYVDWVSGGAMFVRMESIKTTGGMDERYFLYMEDMDWCRVLWAAGWRVAYVPAIGVVHRAQHENTRHGLKGLCSQATRLHLASYIKYLFKWGFKTYSPSHQLACTQFKNRGILL